MCAIFGLIKRKEKVIFEEIKRCIDIMSYRGPDEEGIFIEENFGFGHKRLSIIDLKTGRQPLFNEDKSLILICNGEIYNFHQLREKLKKNHKFYTNSDSEVILHLYEEKKEKSLYDLRGMFAFAIWDRGEKKLFIARDRIGKKPLVYFFKNGIFAFSSEIKGLLKLKEISKEIDFYALDEFFTYQSIPSPKTIFKEIKKLPPSHYLIYKNGEIKIEKYWEINFTEKLNLKDENEYMELLWEKLKEAVKIRLISDVPLGAFLSGGIDSSTVVGLASQFSSSPLKTFSIGFDVPSYSELKYSKIVSKHFNTEHYQFIVKPDIIEILPKLIWHYNEPFGDSSMVPTYYVARETKKYVKVALNGDGGDENFAGYERYYQTKLLEKIYKIIKKTGIINKKTKNGIKKLYEKKFYSFPVRVLEWLREADEYGFCYAYTRRLISFSSEWKEKIYSDFFKNEIKNYNSLQLTENLWQKIKNLDLIEKMIYTDFNLYLPEVLMVKMDIATMASSLEARSPFLDHIFIETIAKFPPELKLKGKISKYIIKKKLKGFLPEEILKRRKMGFGVPLDKWFKGKLKDYLIENLLNEEFLKTGIFEKKAIEEIINQHLNGIVNHSSRLWCLLCFSLWTRIFLKN